VARHLGAAAGADEPGDHDIELHEARKAAKRLRYAAEVSVPALGSRAARLVSAAHEVQGVLGGRQDAVVARPVWREVAISRRCRARSC
jgi:CHAD domain-containing protein